MQAYKKRGFWIGLAAFFFVLFLPNPESLSSVGWAVAAVTLLMAIWWATEAVPVAVTALLPLACFPMLGVTDFKTAALPYANGDIHLGHLVEYCQADMYVRALKLLGEDAFYICANDAHGTPIELNAANQGIKPEELVARVHEAHQRDFSTFGVDFDYFGINPGLGHGFSHSLFCFFTFRTTGSHDMNLHSVLL